MDRAERHIKRMMEYRPTLDMPPAPRSETLEAFFDEEKVDEYVHLGRDLKVKKRGRKFKGLVWMYVPEGGGGARAEPQEQGASEPYDPSQGIDEPAKPRPRVVVDSEGFPTMIQPHTTPHLSDFLPFTHHPHHPTPSALSLQTLIPLLDLLGLSSPEHIKTLQDFLHTKLPPGVPVQVELPVGMLPLSGVVKFGEVVECEVEEEVVRVPGRGEGYLTGIVVGGEWV